MRPGQSSVWSRTEYALCRGRTLPRTPPGLRGLRLPRWPVGRGSFQSCVTSSVGLSPLILPPGSAHLALPGSPQMASDLSAGSPLPHSALPPAASAVLSSVSSFPSGTGSHPPCPWPGDSGRGLDGQSPTPPLPGGRPSFRSAQGLGNQCFVCFVCVLFFPRLF